MTGVLDMHSTCQVMAGVSTGPGEGKARAEVAWRHGQLGLCVKDLQWGQGTVRDSTDFFCMRFHAAQGHSRKRLEKEHQELLLWLCDI